MNASAIASLARALMAALSLSACGCMMDRAHAGPGVPFPDVYLEGAWRPPDISSGFYDTPGVYLFDRQDIRSSCDTSGSIPWVLPANRTPQQHGQDIFSGQVYLRSTFQQRWKNVGKPFRYAVLLTGAAAADCRAVRLNTHPDDTPNDSIFYRHGREEAGRYYAGAISEYKRLMDQSPGTPLPAAILDDNEILPDLSGAFAKGYPGRADEREGFWARAQADPRFSDPAEFTETQSLRDWAAARSTLLNGSKIPAFDRRLNGYYPDNWDAQATATEAGYRAVMQAQYVALGLPVANTFGLSVPHGSWALHSRSRAFPFEVRPKQQLYNLDGDFPLAAQILVNYSDPPAFRPETDSGPMARRDSRWETPSNYIARAIELGANIPADATAYEKGIRAATFFRKREAYAAYRATPGTAFWVSIKVQDKSVHSDPMSDPEFLVRANCMIDFLMYCVNTCGLANGGVWFFAPGYDSDPLVRAQVQAFIRMMRAAFDSGVSPVKI